METVTITHEPDRKGFFASIDGHKAELTYRVEPDGTLAYNHTYVPEELRGKGIAGKITRYALEWARENGKKVRPVCPYIVSFVKKNPEFDDISAA